MDLVVWLDVFTLCCHFFNRWCHFLTFLQALPKVLEHVGLENHNMDILKGQCFGHFYVLFYCSDHCITNVHSTQISSTWEKVSNQKSIWKGIRTIWNVRVTSLYNGRSNKMFNIHKQQEQSFSHGSLTHDSPTTRPTSWFWLNRIVQVTLFIITYSTIRLYIDETFRDECERWAIPAIC